MSRFTDGKWVQGIHKGEIWAVRPAGEVEFPVCKVDCGSEIWPMSDDEVKANINLIVAAPELLKALKACIDLMPPLEKPAIAGRAANRIEKPVIQRALDVIAKAEGGI